MKNKLTNLILIILIVLFCMAISPVTMQNDTYYSIAIGEHILENGIDMKDPFSWHEDLSYTYPHWGYDVATYLVHSAGQAIGGEVWAYGLIYLSTCILSAVLGITIYKVNEKIVGNRLISFVITIASIYVLKGYIAARAQLVTFILFVLEIYFIEQFLKSPKKSYVLGLVLIPILIANLHVAVWWFYFILYIPYIAEFFMCKAMKKQDGIILNKIEVNENRNVKYLIIIMIICLFTGLLTPLREVPYTYLIKTMMGNTTSNINEHLPMTLINHMEILVALGVTIVLLVCSKVKLKLRDAFMLCGLVFLMFYTRRQLTMFVLIGGIILNKLLSKTLDEYKESGTQILENILLGKFGVAMISLLIVILSVYFVVQKREDTFVSKSTYPVEASEWILENLDLDKIRLFNEYNYGSYLLYKGIPVFIDSRADLYAPEFNTKTGKVEDGKDIFMDFINVSNLNIFYENIFEKYDITHIILYRNSKINSIICNTNDGTYNSLYEDDYFAIYEIEK
jgi:hypothetical protein